MPAFLTTLLAFAVAIGVLIAVHEWGHYRMAVACGVKVLRFSIGFGPALLRYKPRHQRPGQDTEFVLAAIPLGGYVKMLDERESPVAANERNRAFNAQPLRSRALVAAAGPVANLLLAVALYAVVNWVGVQEPLALLSPPPAESMAARAGLQGGERLEAAALDGKALVPMASFEQLRWLLTRAALDGRDVRLQVVDPSGASRTVDLPLAALQTHEPDAALFKRIGLVAPLSKPVIAKVLPDEAAASAGLQAGDVVLRAGQTAMADGQQLRQWIADSAAAGAPTSQTWEVDRDGRVLQLAVQPAQAEQDGKTIGRIGAMVGSVPEMILVRRGPVQGLVQATQRVWEISALSLRLLGRMVLGQVSLKNLSGPVAIADYAGQSVSLGLTYYLGFLAFISVSLGVLNLLPIPVLDGGHLMYYLWEAVTGKPVSDAWMGRLQYFGMALLLGFMSIAIYNDIVYHVMGRLG